MEASLSVIVPIYNESAAIVGDTLARLLDSAIVSQIIVVDDGSQPPLGELPILSRVIQLRQFRNSGKGAAINWALQYAKEQIVVIQDADGEYPVSSLDELVAPILRGQADAVYGSRFLGTHAVMSLWHYLGNKCVTYLTNIVANLSLSDVETGHKAIRRSFLNVPLRERRFGFEVEVTMKLARQGARIWEVPVPYSARTKQQGKKLKWKDGPRAIWCAIKYGVLCL